MTTASGSIRRAAGRPVAAAEPRVGHSLRRRVLGGTSVDTKGASFTKATITLNAGGN